MKTFNVKLFIYLPLFLLLAVALLLFAVYRQAVKLEEGYFETVRSGLAARDFLMREPIREYIRRNEYEKLRAYCANAAKQMNIRVTVIDGNGKILAESENDPHFMENHLERPEIASALAGTASGATRYSSTLATDMSYYAMPISVDGKNYCIRTAVGSARLGILLKQAFRTILLAGIIGALVAAGLAFYLFRLVTHPLDELRHAAEKVARGDYDVSLPVPANGEIRMLAVALNSMSEELKAKLAKITREKNERDAILSSMTEGVILVKGSGIIKRWNRAAETMFRFTGAGERELSFAAVTGSRELIRLTEEAKNTEGICEAELTLNMPGGPRSFIARAGRLNLGEKRRPGVLLVLTDITVIRKLEDFRRDFIADVSHEIKTPLTSIVAAVETLENARGDQEAQARFLKIITQQATRLNALVQDILSLSNLEHKRLSSAGEMQELSIEGVLREAIPLQHIIAAAQRPVFKEDGAREPAVRAGVAHEDELIAERDARVVSGVNFAAHGLRFDPHAAVHIRALDHDLEPAEVEDVLPRFLYGEVVDLLMRPVCCLKADARLQNAIVHTSILSHSAPSCKGRRVKTPLSARTFSVRRMSSEEAPTRISYTPSETHQPSSAADQCAKARRPSVKETFCRPPPSTKSFSKALSSLAGR